MGRPIWAIIVRNPGIVCDRGDLTNSYVVQCTLLLRTRSHQGGSPGARRASGTQSECVHSLPDLLVLLHLAGADVDHPMGVHGDIVLVGFFQAEDGIRDTSVTGVQTCALPI